MRELYITSIVSIIVCLFGSGGVVMWFLNRKQTREDAQRVKDESRQRQIMEGIKLGLENDAVIFKALREHKINGESEAQEEKMNTFFRNNFI